MKSVHTRKKHGYTIIELMIIISIIGVVIGLLFFYYNKGWKAYNKGLQFAALQSNGRSGLEQLAINLKQANKDLVYVGNNFDPGVPIPEDAYPAKPYIYFTKPNFEISEDEIKTVSYDYYLYYISKAKDVDIDQELEFGPSKRGKLKLMIVKDQDKEYTESGKEEWPFLPPALIDTKFESKKLIVKSGLWNNIELQDVSEEFSTYKSNFFFGFVEDYNDLFQIRVNMFDERTKTRVQFETAITPRN